MDAAENLVFVDLETTGGNAAHHRITEIGIVRVANGAVVEEWSSLVNPGCEIPSYIVAFTGISNEMVAAAPRFTALAATVFDKLLRRGLRGAQCALRLLVPVCRVSPRGHALCRHGAVHRQTFAALVSAARAPQFGRGDGAPRAFVQCPASCPRRCAGAAGFLVQAAARDTGGRCLRRRRRNPCSAVVKLPEQLPPELADELPEGPGVYRLFGADDALLYIGRSNSLRTRVLAQLGEQHPGSRDQKLAAQVRRVDWRRRPVNSAHCCSRPNGQERNSRSTTGTPAASSESVTLRLRRRAFGLGRNAAHRRARAGGSCG